MRTKLVEGMALVLAVALVTRVVCDCSGHLCPA
jgi:hypothetical protein